MHIVSFILIYMLAPDKAILLKNVSQIFFVFLIDPNDDLTQMKAATLVVYGLLQRMAT